MESRAQETGKSDSVYVYVCVCVCVCMCMCMCMCVLEGECRTSNKKKWLSSLDKREDAGVSPVIYLSTSILPVPISQGF